MNGHKPLQNTTTQNYVISQTIDSSHFVFCFLSFQLWSEPLWVQQLADEITMVVVDTVAADMVDIMDQQKQKPSLLKVHQSIYTY